MVRALVLAVAAGLLLATPATAKVQTKEIAYLVGDTRLQGVFAWDDATEAKRPGVLVVHEWWGLNAHARRAAERLAEAGYAAFALDLFGAGKVATHPDDARAFVAAAAQDPGAVRARFEAALRVLQGQPQVDSQRIAAIGYCFGGTVALTMAREGLDLDAVVVLHGGLTPTGPPAAPGKVKGRILVLTGGADPMVPPEQVAGFEREMRGAGVAAEVVTYPGAKHGFTNPDAGRAGTAAAYDADADRKSWEATLAFLKKTLGS